MSLTQMVRRAVFAVVFPDEPASFEQQGIDAEVVDPLGQSGDPYPAGLPVLVNAIGEQPRE